MVHEKSVKDAHKEIQKKIFAMLPEKWDRLYLYASVIDHFNKLQSGEMFFFYYPKGVLKKKPVNVYEVPVKFNIDEKQYFRLADELYAAIKDLRKIDQEEHKKLWSNITISIEKLKYKVEYGFEDLNLSEFDINERHLIWSYRYLDTPYESFNKREKAIIDKYEKLHKEKSEVFELPLYNREVAEKLETIGQARQKLNFVTEEKFEEMEFKKTYIPKSQILNLK